MRSNWLVVLLAVVLVAAAVSLMVYILDNQADEGSEAEHGGTPAVTWTRQDRVVHAITSGTRGAATAGSDQLPSSRRQ